MSNVTWCYKEYRALRYMFSVFQLFLTTHYILLTSSTFSIKFSRGLGLIPPNTEKFQQDQRTGPPRLTGETKFAVSMKSPNAKEIFVIRRQSTIDPFARYSGAVFAQSSNRLLIQYCINMPTLVNIQLTFALPSIVPRRFNAFINSVLFLLARG